MPKISNKGRKTPPKDTKKIHCYTLIEFDLRGKQNKNQTLTIIFLSSVSVFYNSKIGYYFYCRNYRGIVVITEVLARNVQIRRKGSH